MPPPDSRRSGSAHPSLAYPASPPQICSCRFLAAGTTAALVGLAGNLLNRTIWQYIFKLVTQFFGCSRSGPQSCLRLGFKWFVLATPARGYIVVCKSDESHNESSTELLWDARAQTIGSSRLTSNPMVFMHVFAWPSSITPASGVKKQWYDSDPGVSSRIFLTIPVVRSGHVKFRHGFTSLPGFFVDSRNSRVRLL